MSAFEYSLSQELKQKRNSVALSKHNKNKYIIVPRGSNLLQKCLP